MEENKQKNSRRRLNSLILLVAFTAIMLIVSTYAWFSTQRNVLVSGLVGEVKVAEGMQISLDAKTWTNTIDLSTLDIVADAYSNVTGSDTKTYTNANLKPTELQPVSTIATDTGGTDLTMYRGVNTEIIKLDTIAAVAQKLTDDDGPILTSDQKYPGYFAFDLFLQNSGTVEGDIQGTTTESLQLDATSSVDVMEGGNNTTGLQNTVRVAIAKFSGTADVTADQAHILAATNAASSTISDVAMWEPNSNAHVDNILNSNNSIKWLAQDHEDYGIAEEIDPNTGVAKFAATEAVPTYALTPTAVGQSIANIYDWTAAEDSPVDSGYLAKQVMVSTQVPTEDAPMKVMYLKSTKLNAGAEQDFEVLKNSVIRLRVYVWLEGQDVDTTNYASHGGGIELDLGLVKSVTDTGLLGNESDPSANNSAYEAAP